MPSITERHAALRRETPLPQRVSIRYHEAAVLTGLPVTKLAALVTSGLVKSSKIGRTRLLDTASLIAVINRAQTEPVAFVRGAPVRAARRRAVR